jgi:hypothetical protein
MAVAYTVLGIACVGESKVRALFTLEETHYGRLLLVFTNTKGELKRYLAYAQATLKANYEIKTIAVVADNLDQVHSALERERLLPGGDTRVAVEGSELFDQVVAELLSDTLWKRE